MVTVGGNLPAVILAGHGMDFESLDLRLGLLLLSCPPLPRVRWPRIPSSFAGGALCHDLPSLCNLKFGRIYRTFSPGCAGSTYSPNLVC